MEASQLDAYRLMHEGAIALAKVEQNGIRIDTKYLENTRQQVDRKIRKLRKELQEDEIYKQQLKRFGQKASTTKRQQLATVLAKDYNIDLDLTEKSKEEDSKRKNYKVDEGVLESLNLPYCNKLLEAEKLQKLLTTYIQGIQSQVVGNYLHAVFNLHLVKTFRSSSDSPNFQNFPKHNEAQASLLRKAFIPRPGHVLVEIDYSALEFRIAACQYRDPALLEYASNPEKDIHRDCAAKIFKCKTSQVSKPCRQVAKNKFVFPELYGDWYISCAKYAWEDTKKMNLELANGTSVFDHLKDKGITRLGRCNPKESPDPDTMEYHMKQVEKLFYEWFPVLKDKKEAVWNDYVKNGFFDLMTGFVIKGVWKKNFILNCKVQGPAFHLLLWSVIQLVKWTRKNRTKTKIVGQIHDSVLADVHLSELSDYLAAAKNIMTKKAKEHFKWVIVPLDVEAELSEENWYLKKSIPI